ncbi:putative ribonuclease H-like domain-containing protein [Tanacetum coccineum]
MVDNTQAKAMREVKNVRIQISYQAYLVNFLVLDILVDKEIPLLLGRPFLRTCGAIIDIGRGTMSIDDESFEHTTSKTQEPRHIRNFRLIEEKDWLSCFEVGRDEDGNPKYGHMAPLFLDIEDKMETALAMKAYFNPSKTIVVLQKIVNFLGALRSNLRTLIGEIKGYWCLQEDLKEMAQWHAKFKSNHAKRKEVHERVQYKIDEKEAFREVHLRRNPQIRQLS